MAISPLRIFISYSHRDETLREELVGHIALLKRQGLIAAWYDRMIVPGDDGDAAIDANLEGADIILLLVSADYINSLYCWEKELEQSLERHESNEAIVIPIIVRAVDLQGVSFGHVQSLPTERKPVTSWLNRDEAWADVARGLRKAVERLQERRSRFRETHTAQQIGHILSPRDPSALVNGVRTGYTRLDELLSGLHPSELVVIGSRPSMGKTTLALNLALNAAFSLEKKVTVGFFSLETAREPLASRMISATARVDSNQLRSGEFADDAWSRINGAISLLKHAPLYVDDPPSITTDDLLAKASKLKEEHDLGLLIVDHLQLLDVAEPSTVKSHRNQSRVSKQLKEIARELSVPVIVTSQLSRKIDHRADKRPNLSDLPEGYDLEVYADVVLLLFREEYYDPYTLRRGMADITVAKQRNGPTGAIQLVFSAAQSRFDNFAPEGELPLADGTPR